MAFMGASTNDHDWYVVIVGAGPVGGHTANLLAKRGQRVLLLEEHNEIGRPFQCAGLVTPNAMRQVGLYETILEEVDGALIHGPCLIEPQLEPNWTPTEPQLN